jgi:4-hydroxybenzoate polyprenyltransferase
MRSTGCVINDAWDRNIDGRIERTRNRPLASGALSLKEAALFTFLLGIIGFGVLLSLPPEAIVTGLASIPLIVVYPLAKRVMGFPQIILGLTFSWGALLGWSSHGIWPGVDAFIFYAASICWVFGYDTIYAIQDKDDDRKAGIKSSALTLGNAVRPVVGGVYLVMMSLLIILGARLGLGWGYYAGMAAAALHLRRQIIRLDPAAPQEAGAIFRSNRDTGLIITIAAALGGIT